MKTAAGLAGVLVAALPVLWVLLLGVMQLISESGVEVAELHTSDAGAYATRLWVVEDSGVSWLWAAASEWGWATGGGLGS